jgi:hypothetical protein
MAFVLAATENNGRGNGNCHVTLGLRQRTGVDADGGNVKLVSRNRAPPPQKAQANKVRKK